MARAPVPIGGGAFGEVTDHIDYVTSLASQAVTDTNAYIEELNDILNTLTNLPPVSELDPISLAPVEDFSPPVKPDLPETLVPFPSLPTFPTLEQMHDISISDKPEYTAGDAPTIPAVSPPSDLDATAPDDITVETDWTYPTEPTTSIPSVPTLEDLDLPTVPTITIETWSESLPTTDGIQPPSLTFSFSESPYSSSLLTDVTNKLISQLLGGTGLPNDVEQAIWDRARNREDGVYNRTKDQILVENANRGFTLPSGSITAKLQDASQEVQDKIGSLSRDIAIKQAELEQENLKIAVSNSINLEQINMNYNTQVINRLLDSRKFLQTAAIEIYNAEVQQVQLELDAYKAYADGFETRLRAALTDLEIYRSELEGQKLVGEINQQSIQVYLGQLEGVKTETDIYKTKVDAITAQINAENLKIQNFKAQVDAYVAEIQAKNSEYQLYDSRLKAAMQPLDVYKAEVNAYAERITAYAAEAEAEKTILSGDIAENEFILSGYKTQLDGALGEIEAITKQYEADANVYRSAVSMYNADVGAEGERYRSETAYNKASSDVAVANAQLTIQNSTLALKRATDQIAIATEIIKQQSALASQMAAAALSSMNVGANIGSNTGQNWNYNFDLDDTSL